MSNLDKVVDSELLNFKKTGFFSEKELALQHLRDADEILTSEGVDYCLMFGTLLGLLRHGDFIPWDDDLDIIIFDIAKFEKQCKNKFERKGYVLLKDVRRLSLCSALPFLKFKKNCGYRIYLESGDGIEGVSWKFPWLGVWETVVKNKAMTLPPEDFVYNIDDFFPLQRKPFQGFSVLIPNCADKILNHYFGTNDWMDYCIPSTLDHRHYKPTGFPEIKRPLKEVLSYLDDKG
jgi:LicD family protein